MARGKDGHEYTYFGLLGEERHFVALETFRHDPHLLTIVDKIIDWAVKNHVPITKLCAYRLAKSMLSEFNVTDKEE